MKCGGIDPANDSGYTSSFFACAEQVNISGAVKGTAVWPEHLKPIAWHRDSEMVRMKLGLYHSINNVRESALIHTQCKAPSVLFDLGARNLCLFVSLYGRWHIHNWTK